MFSKSLFVFACCVLPFTGMAEAWRVSRAAVRVDVKVTQPADDPRLGVFLKIQDGGLLPGPYAVPAAFDAKGNPLKSIILSNTKKDGLCLLFEEPKGGKASIYVSGSKTPPAKPKDCNLVPSLIVYTKNTKASLEAAKAMSQVYPPAPEAFCQRWNWFASGVNPTGPDDHYVLWFRGAIKLAKPEQILLATVSDEGSEIWVDGKPFVAWPGIHTRKGGEHGEHGRSVKLDAGLHTIDYFQFDLTGPQEANVVWRREGAAATDLPATIDAYAKSGYCSIEKIELSDGRVSTDFHAEANPRMNWQYQGLPQPINYFWTGKEPLTLFTLSAGETPKGAKVYWEFGNRRRYEGKTMNLMVPGVAESIDYPVTLAVENGKGVARTVQRLFVPWNPRKASINNPWDVTAYLTAFLHLAESKPQGDDPCADWSSDHWQLLMELLAPYRGGKITELLFKNGSDTILRLPEDQLSILQKRYIEYLRLLRDDSRLLSQLLYFDKNSKSGKQRFHWIAERIRACLWDLNRPDLAARELSRLRESSSGADQGRIAALLSGDAAYALGKRDEAMKHYQDAEDRWRSQQLRNRGGGSSVMSKLITRRAAAEKNAAAKNKKGAAAAKPEDKKPTVSFQLPKASPAEAWKTYTVRNSSMYITLLSMLEQNAVADALELLEEWENESPSAKLDGEYPLAAALVYKHVKDWRRAANILDVYVRQTNFSAQLPDAIKTEIECLMQFGNRKRARELAEMFSAKFAGHPYEEQIKLEVR